GGELGSESYAHVSARCKREDLIVCPIVCPPLRRRGLDPRARPSELRGARTVVAPRRDRRAAAARPAGRTAPAHERAGARADELHDRESGAHLTRPAEHDARPAEPPA